MWWRLVTLFGSATLAVLGSLYAISNPGRAALHGTGDSAAWMQAWWSIVAIIVVLTVPGMESLGKEKEEKASRRRAAAMILLVGVRRWYRALQMSAMEADDWLKGIRASPNTKLELPEPKLENSLDRAPDLDTGDVQAILDAMALRDAAQNGIDTARIHAATKVLVQSYLDEAHKLMGSLEPIIARLEKHSGFTWHL